MIRWLSGFFDVRPGEIYRVAVTSSLLFFLIAANNLIKILRDSIFLGHHSASELPYVYILVAIFAGAIISAYARYTARLSLVQLILGTNAIILLMIAGFWFLLTYIDPAWAHYAFYVWSALVTAIAVAQLWTLANQIFSPAEGKRLFGLLTAGGTIGGAAAGFGAEWTLHLSPESNHMLWAVAAIYLAASLLLFVTRRRLKETSPDAALLRVNRAEAGADENIFLRLAGSGYLKTIAALIFVSVIVSTLIDFELKSAAKVTYPSESALAQFFSSYYGWLSVATFFAQVLFTGRALTTLGVTRGLHVTPVALLTGSLAIMIWPGLLAATLTRIADAMLRNSIHRSSMEIIYMGVPAGLKKAIKTFLDVVVERVGDATAGFIILLFSLSLAAQYKIYVHFICVGLILVWIMLIHFLRTGYSEAVRNGPVSGELAAKHESLMGNGQGHLRD
jgi:ATP:ADP antiporter, AAA family